MFCYKWNLIQITIISCKYGEILFESIERLNTLRMLEEGHQNTLINIGNPS